MSRVEEGEERGMEELHDGTVLLLFMIVGDSKTVERERSETWDSRSEESAGGGGEFEGGGEGDEVDGEVVDERKVQELIDSRRPGILGGRGRVVEVNE